MNLNLNQVREIKLQQRPGTDFSFTVNDTIKLAATSRNPEIKLHICEGGPLMASEIATLLIPISDEVLNPKP